MRRRYTAPIDDEQKTTEMFKAAQELSADYTCTIYIVSNGVEGQVIHPEYMDEYKEEGFWLAAMFDNGNRISII